MIRRIAACIGAAMLAVLVGATPGLAHEGRGGICGHKLTVGWGTEPAYAGFQNSVQVRIFEDTGPPNASVPAGAIKVDVSTGDQHKVLSLEPNFAAGFGAPGDYRAFFIPTTPGTWTFALTGKIEGCSVTPKKATFTSGPKTFGDLLSSDEVQFPDKNPASGQIATRLKKEAARLAASTAAADKAAASAKTMGMIGIGLGGLGLIVALIGLRKRT